MAFTKEQIGKLFEEKDSQRVTLTCPKHAYVASKLPPSSKGCKHCWMAYYTWDLASTPAHMRQERLDQLEEVINHVVEFTKKGKFDAELYAPGDPRLKIEYTKDGE